MGIFIGITFVFRKTRTCLEVAQTVFSALFCVFQNEKCKCYKMIHEELVVPFLVSMDTDTTIAVVTLPCNAYF